jgi:hypothetical protein
VDRTVLQERFAVEAVELVGGEDGVEITAEESPVDEGVDGTTLLGAFPAVEVVNTRLGVRVDETVVALAPEYLDALLEVIVESEVVE